MIKKYYVVMLMLFGDSNPIALWKTKSIHKEYTEAMIKRIHNMENNASLSEYLEVPIFEGRKFYTYIQDIYG